MIVRAVAISVLIAASLSATPAWAEMSCGAWNYQSAGVYFQICVDDNGARHCYKATDSSGSNAYEVSCS